MQCIHYCPVVRNGMECVRIGENKKASISEQLCIGCGICVHKCPFDSIRIINLPEELKEGLIHQYGENGFRIFNLPIPREGRVIGILGSNGIGKTTAINILSGKITPNLGSWNDPPGRDDVLRRVKSIELAEYLKDAWREGFTSAVKPQYIDRIPEVVSGTVREILEKKGEGFEGVAENLGLTKVLDREIKALSGGELQMMAIAATTLTEADVYFFDEPSSYLDIYQRLQAARAIKSLAGRKRVVIVEHDLAILDFLADDVHIVYGVEGAYGVVTKPRPVRSAINVYLSGFLREENVRFRETEVKFEARAPRQEWKSKSVITYPRIVKTLGDFRFEAEGGTCYAGEVIGIVGPNGIGKTTFVKLLAGVLEPDEGCITHNLVVSYKPQYLTPDYDGTVESLFNERIREAISEAYFEKEVVNPLGVKRLMEKEVSALSGGEIQRVAVTLCLGANADLYLLDEPSAYMDANQRITMARVIRRIMESRGKTAFVVDHDVYFIDMIGDRLMVFDGEPARHGVASGPFSMHKGMNIFLSKLDITFRRDADSKRPRINKPGSVQDREQHEKGEFYYDV